MPAAVGILISNECSWNSAEQAWWRARQVRELSRGLEALEEYFLDQGPFSIFPLVNDIQHLLQGQKETRLGPWPQPRVVSLPGWKLYSRIVSWMVLSSSCSFCASWVLNSLISCFSMEVCFNSRSSCSCLSNKSGQRWRLSPQSKLQRGFTVCTICSRCYGGHSECACVQVEKTRDTETLMPSVTTSGAWGMVLSHLKLLHYTCMAVIGATTKDNQQWDHCSRHAPSSWDPACKKRCLP